MLEPTPRAGESGHFARRWSTGLWLSLLLGASGVEAQPAAPGTAGENSKDGTEQPTATASSESDVEAMLDLARRAGHQTVLFFRVSWSPWALAMEQQVLPQPGVRGALEGLTLVIVDAERHPDTADRFRVVDFPTVIVTETDGNERGRLVGYASSERLVSEIERILAAPAPAVTEANDAEGLARQILGARRRGNLEHMVELARRLAEMDPENRTGRTDNALAVLAMLESRGGRLEQALTIYTRLAELYPSTELRAHVLLGQAAVASQLGLVRDALAAYDAFLKEFPRHPDAAFARSEIDKLKRLRTRGMG